MDATIRRLGTHEAEREPCAVGGFRGADVPRPEYLCVDDYLKDIVGARAVQAAIELGLIDGLVRHGRLDMAAAASLCRLDPKALRLLLGMLSANRVIEWRGGFCELSAGFSGVLRYRDLLEAKLDFAALVASDFLERFDTLLCDPGRFFDQAKVFDLFSYDRCFDATPENLARTRRWMRFTTALTRYEAQACIDRFDFSASRRLLDVGGNSGEFALRVCRANGDLRATVLDLPLVCAIGREHVAGEPEASRIDFVSVDPGRGKIPTGFDTISFKSMLHDWPDAEMEVFLAQAYDALDSHGRVLIFERGMIEPGPSPLPYSMIPILLFFRSYRSAADYTRCMERIGFRAIRVATVPLEMSFLLIEASK